MYLHLRAQHLPRIGACSGIMGWWDWLSACLSVLDSVSDGLSESSELGRFIAWTFEDVVNVDPVFLPVCLTRGDCLTLNLELLVRGDVGVETNIHPCSTSPHRYHAVTNALPVASAHTIARVLHARSRAREAIITQDFPKQLTD